MKKSTAFCDPFQVFALIFGAMVVVSSVSAQAIPDINVEIQTSVTSIVKSSPSEVVLTITNRSPNSINLGSRVDFRLDYGTSFSNPPTKANGSYYAPVSLVKKYNSSSTRCQTDLEDSRIRRNGPGVSIRPSEKSIIIGKNEPYVFKIDLTKVCWAHRISSVYPNGNIFTELKPGEYSLFASLSISNGQMERDGIVIPLSRSIESNKVSIMIGR